MPELPEVETIKLKLEKYLLGHRIDKVEVNNQKVFTGDIKDIEGSEITKVRRFAKVLSIDLSNGYSILIHVKMTGQPIYRGPNLPDPQEISKKVSGGISGKHTHVIFHLDKNGKLYYNDMRRFGWIKVVKTNEVEKSNFIGKLGPEPFGALTYQVFTDILKQSKRAIKVVLMDQTKISGIGNIYANDALWLSMVNPEKSANALSSAEQKALYDAIHSVLAKGIKYGGCSELSYVTPDGTEGEYQKHTLAYGRKGEPCERCHAARFKKFFLFGRGTYICPVCQQK